MRVRGPFHKETPCGKTAGLEESGAQYPLEVFFCTGILIAQALGRKGKSTFFRVKQIREIEQNEEHDKII